MNRQLYAEGGGIKSLLDIIASNPEQFGDILNILEGGPNDPRRMSDEDKEVMENLRLKQMRPEYQYDEENMYEGPRDMRMDGGIMSVPRQQYGFGSFVSSIFKGAKDIVSDVVDVAKDVADPVAQVASFIPGPHQPFAAAYTAGRGAGIGGSDYGGLQIGGFTPSGGFGIGGGTTSPFSTSFQAGTQAPSSFGLGSFNIPGIGDVATSDVLRVGSQFIDQRGPGGGRQQKQPMSTSDILGKVIQGGLSIYGAKKSYEDQKRINEIRQQQFDEARQRREEKRRQYGLDGTLSRLPVTNRTRTIEDIVRRPGAMDGGVMGLKVRTNPEGVQEIDYREEGGFVPPIGVKEKADDIPAMLSNNEFVFTADAVRAAGGGSVNKGAQKMYALMKQLEAKA